MTSIKLNNRDGANLKLIHDSKNNTWKLNVDDEHKYVFEHLRVGYDEDKTITFVDPSGGPFLSVGDKISGLKILEILPDFSFKLTNERPDNL